MKNKTIRSGLTIVITAALFLIPSGLFASDAGMAKGSLAGMAQKAAAVAEQLNINTAGVEQFANIPGLGSTIGEAITKYRDANGAFSSIADLVNVPGIDAGLLEKIKPFLTL